MARAFDENKNIVPVADTAVLTGQIDMRNVRVGVNGSVRLNFPAGWTGAKTHVLSVSFHNTSSGALKQQIPETFPFSTLMYDGQSRVEVSLQRTNTNGEIYDVYVVVGRIE